MKTPLLAAVLPPESARLLQRAAETPITRADPLARVKAIEKATERVKRDNPQFFQIKEIQNETEA